jgi:hypothetical protein
MELPVRVRQIGPPFDSLEVTSTLDVSRNGVLFRTRQPYLMNSTVWVTMPYQEKSPNNLEVPASVVRIDKRDDGFAEIAVQFHSARADQLRPTYDFTPAAGPQKSSDRRTKNRVRMALPIRVREGQAAEESVTVDVSRHGVLFQSARNYSVGQQVWVVMPYQPGTTPAERPARVVRSVNHPRGSQVALHFGDKMKTETGSYYAR